MPPSSVNRAAAAQGFLIAFTASILIVVIALQVVHLWLAQLAIHGRRSADQARKGGVGSSRVSVRRTPDDGEGSADWAWASQFVRHLVRATRRYGVGKRG